MVAYKLLRKMKDGSLSSLFIGKKTRYEIGKWYDAHYLPTKGYAPRKGFHCTHSPRAPHLSKKDRVWCKVEIEQVEIMNRPDSQGGMWYIAEKMKILNVL